MTVGLCRVCRAPSQLATMMLPMLLVVAGCEDEGPTSPVRTTTSDGFEIRYRVFGEGEPIVLAHGWSASARTNWEQPGWVEALGDGRQVIALDFRGHGDSDKPHVREVYSYHLLANDVLAVMDALGIEKADYVGYSMGAQVGAFLLGHHTERLGSVVLMGIGDETAESLAELATIVSALEPPVTAGLTPEELVWRLAVDVDPRNDRVALSLAAQQMWPEGYPVELGGPGLASVDVSVLLLNGEDDVPYAQTVQPLADALLGATVVLVPDANHFSTVFDHAFRAEVLAFLGGS